MIMNRFIRLSFWLLFLFPVLAFPQTPKGWKSYSYRVVKITDGDTLTATDGNIRFKVRLAGMDAPESRQPYGKAARYALKERLLDQTVQIQSVGSGIDMYGRVLGKVYLGGKDVSVGLIEDGLATYYRPKCVDYPENKTLYDYDPQPYIAAEAKARAAKSAIWSDAGFILPCAYRKAKP